LTSHSATTAPTPFTPEAGFTSLLNGFDVSKWSMSKIKNQAPDKSNPGSFLVVDGTLEYMTGNDQGRFNLVDLLRKTGKWCDK
jgi:hypothetical protein